MNKTLTAWTLAALAIVAAQGFGQQAAGAHYRGEIPAAARIYGYNLAEGNWEHKRARCPALPQAVVLRYYREFADGAESEFTAVVPRGGRVHIVPVFYHGATPFVPAPKNPRNYALFNSLVATPSSGDWLELASCYAEMTGGHPDPGSGRGASRIAGEPSPRVSVGAQDSAARVTFAERDGANSYRVWIISFNRQGQVASAMTEEESVYAAKGAPAIQHRQAQSAVTPAASRQPVLAEVGSPPQVTTSPVAQSKIADVSGDQPGWKPILSPAQPPSKFIPDAPLPPEKMIANPAGDTY